MKPLSALILCLCLLVLCACGQAEPEETTGAATTITTQTTTTTAPTTLPINYPAAYRDAPVAYKPVLDAFYMIDQLVLPENWDELFSDAYAFVWEETHLSTGECPTFAPLGYAVVDINNDGIPELLLLSEESWVTDEEGRYIHSLFTLKDNQPVNISAYSSRHRGYLAADGTIYTSSSGGAPHHILASYKLKPGATELTKLTEYHAYSGDCFIGPLEGERQPITQAEFSKLLEQYDNPPNPMPLNFIPVEQ